MITSSRYRRARLCALAIIAGLWTIAGNVLTQNNANANANVNAGSTQTNPEAAPQKPDVTVQVKVVNVPATVRDKHGKIVNNLSKDDFVLEQDSHPQTIRYFAKESDLPLTL